MPLIIIKILNEIIATLTPTDTHASNVRILAKSPNVEIIVDVNANIDTVAETKFILRITCNKTSFVFRLRIALTIEVIILKNAYAAVAIAIIICVLVGFAIVAIWTVEAVNAKSKTSNKTPLIKYIRHC